MKEGPRRGSQLLCESISCPHQHSPPTLQQAVPAEPCAMQPSFHVPVPSVGGGGAMAALQPGGLSDGDACVPTSHALRWLGLGPPLRQQSVQRINLAIRLNDLAALLLCL